ncbi:MAG: hypothetical protein Q8K02_07245 [Flavobacterium sp.]|nr:hypothetical protein [Flavobacterium sp.]
MNWRWKYQIKTGLIWGSVMCVIMTLFDLRENSFYEQISSFVYYLRYLGYILIGTFFIGYYSWKEKVKLQKKE